MIGETTDPGRGRIERRLRWILAARLLLALLCFSIALRFESVGVAGAEQARQGLLWTLGTAFVASLLSAPWLRGLRSPERFAALQLAIDVGLVTALVHFTGGRESIFSFLYVCVTVYGALLFERRGAFGAATVSAAAYGAALLAKNAGWLDYGVRPETVPFAEVAAIWGVHVGAIFLVGALASVLSGELYRTGAVLDQRTHDLQQLRDLHQRTVDSIMSGLLTTDSAMRVMSLNPEAERITGVRAADVMGVDVDEVIPGCRGVLEDPSVGRRSRVGARSQLTYRSRSGDLLHLGLAGSILREANGEACGYVLIFQDVTRVVAMEEELRRSEKLAAVGELGAKIAHEIRNPLAAISGAIEILRTSTPGDGEDEPARLMDIAVRETERLNGLITDFLAYARPRPPRLKQVGISELVEEVLAMVAVSHPVDVEIDWEPTPGLVVDADADQLRQLLWNLCLNAVQAMPDGGRIWVRAEPIGDTPQGGLDGRRNDTPEGDPHGALPAGRPRVPAWVEIRIRDSGTGLPDEVQDQMFDPFFTTKANGTGLGLPTVHRIVESHGGSLAVESAIGQGTEFRVRLAAAADASSAKETV